MEMPIDPVFGQLLKYWRSQRNFSQLDLSVVSDVSQRHISFLESGRSHPSREMVLKLAAVLDIPLRQQNKMLTTTGYAPLYSEFDLSDPEVAPIRRALEFTLQQQAPYPALVMDRYWNQIAVNEGAAKLIGWLLADCVVPEAVTANLMKLVLHPDGIKAYVENWDAIAPYLIHRVYRESRSQSHSPSSQILLDELLTYPDLKVKQKISPEEHWDLPLLTISFIKADIRLSFFTTITTFGTPHDITLQEIRLESMFPADEATERWFN
ncbi:MAG: helix-turn-helix transcriptional regulator [Cyanobacteria bacterium J06627_32]